MKKILFCFILLFSFNYNVKAEKLKVKLDKCVDGDTAWFILNDEAIKTRFLAINSPEATSEIEPYGKEASEFTCNMLKNANKIQIEYDPNSDEKDKYDRHLVWVFVDDKLLQDEIIKNGLADVDYIYGDYLYTSTLKISLSKAKMNNIGMWENLEIKDYTPLIIVICLFILICLFSTTTRQNVANKVEKETKKKFKKIISKK